MLFGMRRDLQSSLKAAIVQNLRAGFASTLILPGQNLQRIWRLEAFDIVNLNREGRSGYHSSTEPGVGFGRQKEMDSSPEKVRSGRFVH